MGCSSRGTRESQRGLQTVREALYRSECKHTSLDGLGDTGEEIGNRLGRALDALKLVRRSVARWKICCRLDSGEDCGVEPEGRRKDGNLVEFCALDACVEYVKRGLECAPPSRPTG